jgi:hypothetical protein
MANREHDEIRSNSKYNTSSKRRRFLRVFSVPYRRNKEFVRHPILTLAGFWLGDAGFPPGTRVMVHMLRRGKIVLTVVEENDGEVTEESV